MFDNLSNSEESFVNPLFRKVVSDVEKTLGQQFVTLGLREEQPSIPEIQLGVIQERSTKFDCAHPHARRCWILLNRALTNDYQAMHNTSVGKIEKGSEYWKIYKTKTLNPAWVDREDKLKLALKKLVNEEEPDTELPEADELISEAASSLYVRGQKLQEEMPPEADLWRIAGFREQGDKPLEQARALTIELISMIDMALGAGDVETFNAAMIALQDINPSAFRALTCLTGVSGMTIMSGVTNRDPLSPTVPELLTGMSLPSKNIVGGLTGTVYFEKQGQVEVANPLTVLGAIWGLISIFQTVDYLDKKMFPDKMKEWENDKPEREAVADKIDKLLEEADELQKRRPWSTDLGVLGATRELQRLKTELMESPEPFDKVMTPNEALQEAEVIETNLRNFGDMYDAGGLEVKSPPTDDSGGGIPFGGSGGTITSDDKSIVSANPVIKPPPGDENSDGTIISGGSGSTNTSEGSGDSDAGIAPLPKTTVIVDPPLKKEVEETEDEPKTATEVLIEDLDKEFGVGAGHGEMPEPGTELESFKPDIKVSPGKEAWILTTEDAPGYEDLLLSGAIAQIEQKIVEIEPLESTIRYDEEAWAILQASETAVIDLGVPDFSPLPGDVEKLENCYSADPDPSQAKPPVSFS